MSFIVTNDPTIFMMLMKKVLMSYHDLFFITPKGVYLLEMGTINDLLILNYNLMVMH
jgi:hypothetical protein